MMRLEVFRLATEMLQYLDPDGLDETVLNIGQIKTNLEGQISDLEESIEEEIQDLPYARPDGLYPDMTVGAVQGAPQTSQWTTRESTGSGTAQVESVQGATVAWNQLANTTSGSGTVLNGAVSYVKSATDGSYVFNGTVGEGTNRTIIIATGIPITTGHKYLLEKHNDELLYYMNVNGSYNHITNVASIFTAAANSANTQIILGVPNDGYTFDDYKVVPQLFDLTQMFGSGNEPTTVAEFEAIYPKSYYPYSAPTLTPVRIAGIASTDANGDALDGVEWPTQTLRAAGSVRDELTTDELVTRVGVRAYQAGDESDSDVVTDGTNTAYALATPTTTPISPLPMTYRVKQGGTESIIVPDGEVSAAPLLTVAEPVNMSTELARIWAAIESLGYTRNAAQLSRSVSLTDIGSIDEVQNDTTEIETIKEVQE